MVRAKNPNQPKGKEKKLPLLESMRMEIPHNYQKETFLDKRLKNAPATDSHLFICKLYEKRMEESIKKRQVVLGKPPNYNELSELPRLRQLFDFQDWGNLFEHVHCCPYLVRLFYANLHTFEDDFGDLVVRSYVRGKKIEFTSYNVNQMFDMEDGGWCISLKDDDTEGNIHAINREEVSTFLFRGGSEGPNSMDIYGRAVAMVIVQYIQCRAGKDMTDSDYILTYKVMKQEKINFGDVFVHNIELTNRSKTKKLPYGQLLTRILELNDVHPEENDAIEKTVLFFGYRNLHAILGKRKRDGSAASLGNGEEGSAEQGRAQNNDGEEKTHNVTANDAVMGKIEKLERKLKRMKESLKIVRRKQREQTALMSENFAKIMALLQHKECSNAEKEVCQLTSTDEVVKFAKETAAAADEAAMKEADLYVHNFITQIVAAIDVELQQEVNCEVPETNGQQNAAAM